MGVIPVGRYLPEPGRKFKEFGASFDAGDVQGEVVFEALLPSIIGILVETLVAYESVAEVDSLRLEGKVGVPCVTDPRILSVCHTAQGEVSGFAVAGVEVSGNAR